MKKFYLFLHGALKNWSSKSKLWSVPLKWQVSKSKDSLSFHGNLDLIWFDEHGLALHSPSFPLHGSPNIALRLRVAIDQTAASKPSPSVPQLVHVSTTYACFEMRSLIQYSQWINLYPGSQVGTCQASGSSRIAPWTSRWAECRDVRTTCPKAVHEDTWSTSHTWWFQVVSQFSRQEKTLRMQKNKHLRYIVLCESLFTSILLHW
jgi:hypothetical protein